MKSTTFYCFSPPVMLATFTIEIFFAAYVLWRYKMSLVTKLVVAVLVMLATFQGTEYLLCGGIGVNGGTWSRIGYSAITLLPPLGLHLVHAIVGKKSKFLVPIAYASAGAFIAYFALGVQAISGHTCYANYAVFDTQTGGAIASFLFGTYYYVWLVTTTAMAFRFGNTYKKFKKPLYALALGHLAFMLPTITVNLLDPSTLAGAPSIMCGFAVILAFVLVGKVAPETIAMKHPEKSILFKLPF